MVHVVLYKIIDSACMSENWKFQQNVGIKQKQQKHASFLFIWKCELLRILPRKKFEQIFIYKQH